MYSEYKYGLTLEELEEYVLVPYHNAGPIVLNGRIIGIHEVDQINIRVVSETAPQLKIHERLLLKIFPLDKNDIFLYGTCDVTDDFIKKPISSIAGYANIGEPQALPPVDTQAVFVVHGRDGDARDAMFIFLRSIGLQPLEWSEAVQSTGKTSPHISEVLDVAFSRAHAVVVLFTPDDEARLKESFRNQNDLPHETELTGQARPNVLFEAGMAMGRSADRTILVEVGVLRPFSDIAGRLAVRLDNTSRQRQELAQRLRIAGCPVNLEGKDWHTAGDFA